MSGEFAAWSRHVSGVFLHGLAGVGSCGDVVDLGDFGTVERFLVAFFLFFAEFFEDFGLFCGFCKFQACALQVALDDADAADSFVDRLLCRGDETSVLSDPGQVHLSAEVLLFERFAFHLQALRQGKGMVLLGIDLFDQVGNTPFFLILLLLSQAKHRL